MPQLLDSILPRFDFRERHAVDVAADPAAVYEHVRRLDFGTSRLVRALVHLRGMPADALSLAGASSGSTGC
jgi:hypothetical protein